MVEDLPSLVCTTRLHQVLNQDPAEPRYRGEAHGEERGTRAGKESRTAEKGNGRYQLRMVESESKTPQPAHRISDHRSLAAIEAIEQSGCRLCSDFSSLYGRILHSSAQPHTRPIHHVRLELREKGNPDATRSVAAGNQDDRWTGPDPQDPDLQRQVANLDVVIFRLNPKVLVSGLHRPPLGLNPRIVVTECSGRERH